MGRWHQAAKSRCAHTHGERAQSHPPSHLDDELNSGGTTRLGVAGTELHGCHMLRLPQLHQLRRSTACVLRGGWRRRLLSSTPDHKEKCPTGYPEEDPLFGRGLLTCETLDSGGVVLYALGVLYMFFALGACLLSTLHPPLRLPRLSKRPKSAVTPRRPLPNLQRSVSRVRCARRSECGECGRGGTQLSCATSTSCLRSR
jgi:hypothetical protein